MRNPPPVPNPPKPSPRYPVVDLPPPYGHASRHNLPSFSYNESQNQLNLNSTAGLPTGVVSGVVSPPAPDSIINLEQNPSLT